MPESGPPKNDFKGFFDKAVIGAFRSTPGGRFLVANAALASIYGYDSPEELLRSVTDIANQLYADPLLREDFADLVREKGSISKLDVEFIRRDGTRGWASLSARLVRDDRGEVQYYEGTVEDISHWRRAEAALRESEERFRSAFDNAPIGMAIVGTDGHFLQVNHALCEILGYSDPELLALSFHDITHPEDLYADANDAGRLLTGEISTYSMEKRYFHKAGHMVWVLLHGSLVRDPVGAPLYFIAQFKDVTQRRTADLEREKLVGELKEALGRVKVLSAILSSCASCKKIHEEETDTWVPFEVHLARHTDTLVSHGICPDCIQRLYPERVRKPGP